MHDCMCSCIIIHPCSFKNKIFHRCLETAIIKIIGLACNQIHAFDFALEAWNNLKRRILLFSMSVGSEHL